LRKYLNHTEIIDFKVELVQSLATELARQENNKIIIAKKCFEWVRDNIKHSYDFKLNPVTCKASEVLKYKTGYCYAKSHLLVALLRANNIPAGLCYQRLSKKSNGAPYCLHGLTAIYLPEHGWYRVDPIGNKEGVNAQFNPPVEMLAFKVKDNLEADLPEIWPNPVKEVINVLTKYTSYQEVWDNLPDIELIKKYNNC